MSKILIISDLHGNLEALKSALDEKYDAIVCAGDFVDYGPDPQGVIDLSKDFFKVVMGNHDSANAFNIDCHCSQKFHELSVETRSYFKKYIRNLDFLRNLKMEERFEIDGLKFILVHASLVDPLYDYIFENISDDDLKKKFKNTEADVVIFGHSHHKFLRKVDKTIYINPGSVGQPRDGDWRSSLATLDTENLKVEFKRKEYEIEKTVAKIKDTGLSEKTKNALIDILKNGGSNGN